MIKNLRSLDINYLKEGKLKIEATKAYFNCAKDIMKKDMSEYSCVEIIDYIKCMCIKKCNLFDKVDEMFKSMEGVGRLEFEDDDEYTCLMQDYFGGFEYTLEDIKKCVNPRVEDVYYSEIEKPKLRDKLTELRDKYRTFYKCLDIKNSNIVTRKEIVISDGVIDCFVNDPESDFISEIEVEIYSDDIKNYVKRYKFNNQRMDILRYIIQEAIWADDNYNEILIMDISEDYVYLFLRRYDDNTQVKIDGRGYSEWSIWGINLEIMQETIKARLMWDYFLKLELNKLNAVKKNNVLR